MAWRETCAPVDYAGEQWTHVASLPGGMMMLARLAPSGKPEKVTRLADAALDDPVFAEAALVERSGVRIGLRWRVRYVSGNDLMDTETLHWTKWGARFSRWCRGR